MNTAQYDLLLRRSQLHLFISNFIEFIKLNNEVVFENEFFVLIKNAKYHTDSVTHYTGFLKKRSVELMFELSVQEWRSLQEILFQHKDLLFYSNPKSLKTVKFYHFHLCSEYPYKYMIDNNLV